MKALLLIAAFVILVVAMIAFVLGRMRYNNRINGVSDRNPASARKTMAGGIGGIVLALCLVAAAIFVSDDDSAASDGEKAPANSVAGEAPKDPLFDCPKLKDEAEFYSVKTPNFGHKDDGARKRNTASSDVALVGHGAPLDSDSNEAAAKDLFARTAKNPKLTAELAYVFRLEGFTPDQKELAAVNEDPTSFLHQSTANLVVDKKLWVQTREALCHEMRYAYIVEDWAERDVVEFASRPTPHTVKASGEDVELPVRTVPVRNDPRPKGVDLLWMVGHPEGDNVDSRIDVAVEMEFAWVVSFGEVPENLEEFRQTEDTTSTTAGESAQDARGETQDSSGDAGSTGGETGGGSGGDSGGANGGHGGGSGGGCGGSGCGTGGGDTGGSDGSGGSGGGGSGCSHDCPGSGGGGDGDGDGCSGCETPTTNPPTTRPPTTSPPTTQAPPPTTSPPTTQAPPPTTSPPTTQAPPPTTSPPKSPDPGCDQPEFCD